MVTEQIQALCRRERVKVEVVGAVAGASWVIRFELDGRFSTKPVGFVVPALKPDPEQILANATSITVTWWDRADFERFLEASIANRLS